MVVGEQTLGRIALIICLKNAKMPVLDSIFFCFEL